MQESKNRPGKNYYQIWNRFAFCDCFCRTCSDTIRSTSDIHRLGFYYRERLYVQFRFINFNLHSPEPQDIRVALLISSHPTQLNDQLSFLLYVELTMTVSVKDHPIDMVDNLATEGRKILISKHTRERNGYVTKTNSGFFRLTGSPKDFTNIVEQLSKFLSTDFVCKDCFAMSNLYNYDDNALEDI